MSSLMDKLKAGRGKQISAMTEAVKSRGGFQKDERIWKYSGVAHNKLTDKGKKQQYSKSVIRILPVSFADMQRAEDGKLAEHQILSPVISVIKNNFEVSGRYFNELNRREMLGEEHCPINDYDRAGWSAWKDAGKPDDSSKRVLVGRLPKTDFYCNILVREDLANPENNGKVFLFKFTNAIMGLINEAIDPSMPGKESFDPYDLFEGRDLLLEFMMPEQTFGSWTGFAARDIDATSKFLEPSPIAETEEEIERIMTEAYSLTEFTDLKLFKSPEDFEKRFYEVMGITKEDAKEDLERAPISGSAGKGDDDSSAPIQKLEESDEPEDDEPPVQKTTVSDEEQDYDDEFERMLADTDN